MDAEGKLVDICTLAAKIKYADLGVRNTAVEAGFGIWLSEKESQLQSNSILAKEEASGTAHKGMCCQFLSFEA